MRLEPLMAGIAAVYVATTSYSRPLPPRGRSPRAGRDLAPFEFELARVASGVHAAGIDVAPVTPAVPPGRRWRAHRRSVLWLPATSQARSASGAQASGPRGALLPACPAGNATAQATSASSLAQDPVDILIEARTAKEGANRSQVEQEVRYAEARLVWICGGKKNAGQRRSAWLALDDSSRRILGQLGLVHTAWSLALANPETNQQLALALIAEDLDVSIFTVDGLCRIYWVHGVQTLVAPFRDESAMQIPLDFLRAVYALTNTPMALAVDVRLRLRADIDTDRLSAAQQLYEQAKNLHSEPGYPENGAQQNFRLALDDDLSESLRSMDIIPDAAPNYHYSEAGIWHDGLALRGAVGMSADAMSRQLQRRRTPKGDADRLIRQRLRDLGESTSYLIGTPHHSMASIVLRLAPALGLSTRGLGNASCLVSTFQNLVDQSEASQIYPINPLLMAARHCARACGVLDSISLNEEDLLTRETRTLLQAGSPPWRENPEGPNPALSFPWIYLSAMARNDHPLTHSAFESLAIEQYVKLRQTREIIVKPNMTELNLATLAWFQERLSAYLPALAFNENLADTPALRAKAKEMLRMAGQLATEPAITRTASGIIKILLKRGEPPTQTQLEKMAVLLQTISMHGVVQPLGHIFEALVSGDPERIVDIVPFLGSAYQIEQGVWNKNWSQAGMGVARLGADILFTWLLNMAGREVAETVISTLDESSRELFELPAVSMLKDYQRDANAARYSIEPRGANDYASVGESASHELRYSEGGAGVDNEGKLLTGMPRQFGDRPPSADSANLRRTVEDCKSFFEQLEAAETEPAMENCGWAGCFSVVGSFSGPVSSGDPFIAASPEQQAHLAAVRNTFGATPTWRSLAAHHSRSAENGLPIRIESGGDGIPITLLARREILMPTDMAITDKQYIGLVGPEHFKVLEAYLHEMAHGLTYLRDNPGFFPWMHRGPVLPICDQMIYESVARESNAFFDPRIVYERYIPVEESRPRYEQAWGAHAAARKATLRENVVLDDLFARRNARLPGYTILGTAAEKRVTVAQAPLLVSQARAAASGGPDAYRASLGFSRLVRFDENMSSDSSHFQTRLVLLFERLCLSSRLFLNAAQRWLVDAEGLPWKFVIDDGLGGSQPLAWQVDRYERTVRFNGRTLFYLSRGGPRKLDLERSFVAWMGNAVYGGGRPRPLFDRRFNRGFEVLWENLVYNERGEITQRISAELTERPHTLWNRLTFAGKAASDEDVRLNRILAPLHPAALAKIRPSEHVHD